MESELQERRQLELEGHVASTAKTSDQAADNLAQIKWQLVQLNAKASNIRAAVLFAAAMAGIGAFALLVILERRL